MSRWLYSSAVWYSILFSSFGFFRCVNLWKGSYCYEWGKSIIFITFKIMNSLLMTNISLNTQLLVLCFYSSRRFVYQYSLSRMVTSGPYQETSWLYCTSLYWQQQQKCPGVWGTLEIGGGSRAWGVWFPSAPFFLASWCISGGFCRFEAQSGLVVFFFSSAPVPGRASLGVTVLENLSV